MGQDKYTDFWKNFVYKIRDAFAQGQNTVQLDVKQLAEVGDRSSYTGSVTVRFGQVVSFTDAAPYRDLVEVLRTSTVLKPYLSGEFIIKVNSSMSLNATYTSLTIEDLVKIYKKMVSSDNNEPELYKWKILGKPHFDLDAPDFHAMLKAIDFRTLIFMNARVVQLELAKNYPEEMRSAFRRLFDESINLQERIIEFRETVDVMYRRTEPKLATHQDERSIATYLTYYNPEKYSFYKESFYSKYCKLLGEKTAAVNEKYVHYLQLVRNLTENYIKPDLELQQLEKAFTPEDGFTDPNFTLLAQDILYRTLDINKGNQEEGDDPVEGIGDGETDGGSENDSKGALKALVTSPVNQILYGPPGTGKTFNSINYALAIIEGRRVEDVKAESVSERETVKRRFDNLLVKDWDNPKGRIGFITFHQSMSYEDFIEGIKPIPPAKEGEQMTYEVVPGIFKRIVSLASVRSGNFEDVIDNLKKATFEGSGTPVTIKAAATIFDLKYKGGPAFYVHPHNAKGENAWYPVNISHIQQYFEKDTLEGAYNHTYVREIVNYLKKEKGLRKATSSHEQGEPYVLIIDEINRGNISQIFGELITLIEDGKRIGKTEELSVTLPYSREVFSVPTNFYIIGTMNTADRSVEALDTALRRRFTFEFIPPDSTLLKDKQITNESYSVNLKEILDTINERIAYLLDDDHQIGHSYFLSVSTVEDLRIVFSKSIVPLLKEYFYNDFGKIRMVLGDGFVTKKTGTEAKPRFAVSDESFVMERTVYSIKEIKEDFDIVAALNITLGNE